LVITLLLSKEKKVVCPIILEFFNYSKVQNNDEAKACKS
jgi:hypothetical protein